MTELAVEDLTVAFPSPTGGWSAVVRAASLRIESGESVGLVGESGAGKSLTARAIIGLLPAGARVRGGRILLDGVDLLDVEESVRRRVRGSRIGWMLQEPGGALNPVMTIGAQVEEVTRFHQHLDRRAARREVERAFERLALPDPRRIAAAYPHQLSGGQRQRALLALALAARPEILLADEPTTALDVTVQAEILDLLSDLRRDLGIGILLVTHDLAVVAETCSRAYVMYAGETVEEGRVESLFTTPAHPYTRGLLEALPQLGRPTSKGALPFIPGQIPDPSQRPPGCPFHPRCPEAMTQCRDSAAPRVVLGPDRRVRCHLHGREEGSQ